MNMLKLKNGTEECEPLVLTVMASLRHLNETQPIAVFELASKCRDSSHKLFGNNGKVLTDLALLDSDCGVHSSIKNIVLSAIEGDGMDMMLCSPIAKATI